MTTSVSAGLGELAGLYKTLGSTDLDETRQLVSGIFCDHRLSLRRAGAQLDYCHIFQGLNQISLSLMQYGAETNVQPVDLDQFYLIQLPLSGYDRLHIEGCSLLSSPALGTVHGPGSALEMNWSEDCQKLAVRIERAALEQHASGLFDLDQPPQVLSFDHALNLSSAQGMAWRHQVTYLFTQLRQAPHLFNQPLVRNQFEQTLMTSLLSWHRCKSTHSVAPRRVLPHHIKRALEFLHHHVEQTWTVADLANYAGVSVRSLYAGFQQYLNTSPKQYLLELKMQRVHQALLDPERPQSVTEIATACGFFQLGRFAAAYRKRFGESPSETLKRR